MGCAYLNAQKMHVYLINNMYNSKSDPKLDFLAIK